MIVGKAEGTGKEMTPKEAKDAINTLPDVTVTSTQIDSPVELAQATVGKNFEDEWKVLVDGHFTADQLEAIAMWMRDPAGVASAE